MALIQNWLPPSRENWEIIAWAWQFFPAVTLIQWLTDYYPQGKTSVTSRFNIPGKIGWATMEAPGFITLLYIMFTLPGELNLSGLPRENWVMAGMFTIHYLYRAIVAPLFLNPSMSPMHPIVWLGALIFQLVNATSIGGWLAGYGPTTRAEWAGRFAWMQVGMMIWAFGLLGNIFHDDELREIRRAAARDQKRREEAHGEGKSSGEKGKVKVEKKGVDKVYMMPQNGLFELVLYPHYLCEWIEWAGFWMVGGLGCLPARSFLLNEVTTMLPRALSGRRWYIQRFGRDKVGSRRAVIPGLL
ncbi:MAG: hypothetical protein M1832_000096 [Thelocarpon impressellum]|nr:MAG: hypothetical protein M1832_000096 [Thelocarpon impressellum]